MDSGHPRATATALSSVLGTVGEVGGWPRWPLAPLAPCGCHAGGQAGPLLAAGWAGVPMEGWRGQGDPRGKGESLASAGNCRAKVEGSAPTHLTTMEGWDKAAWHKGEEEEGSLHFNPPAAGAKHCHPGPLLFGFWFCCRMFRLKWQKSLIGSFPYPSPLACISLQQVS